MRNIPIGIYRNEDSGMPDFRVENFNTDKYRAVELREDRRQRPVVIMRSSETAPLSWKVVYGFSQVFFRTFPEAIEFCNSRGFKLVKKSAEGE